MSSGIDALDDKRIGFIGCGAMARALAGGLIAAGIPADRLRASDLADSQREELARALGIETTGSNSEIVASSDVVVVCLKPHVVSPMLADLADLADPPERGRPLWISIAAGVPVSLYAEALPEGARIIRAMPNTPALVGAGATAFCAGRHASDEDRAVASALFSAVGLSWEASNEEQLDAVTGLSGSGPAYVFLILEALGDAGVRQGLPRDAAYRLACQTVYGAAKLALESDAHPGALKDQVTTPGGTTIAGLERLETAGVRAALYDAVAAATARSKELAGR
ncbi:MAG: pyrroline-5-carboxylate reductase [Deltaproteobacteria bacterium]|nr:pyrroline-5-carboxylate reductase [Deltaproteobacteria bacterium]MBW2420195.1 pyrroline-5-carboxylate reductase [Deltaproteobacteria bacterium]